MEPLQKYFDSLQKHFKTQEKLSYDKSEHQLRIISDVSPSSLILNLQKNSGVFETNLKRAISNIILPVIYKSNELIINLIPPIPEVSFLSQKSKNDVYYLDILPEEIIAGIASYLKYSDIKNSLCLISDNIGEMCKNQSFWIQLIRLNFSQFQINPKEKHNYENLYAGFEHYQWFLDYEKQEATNSSQYSGGHRIVAHKFWKRMFLGLPEFVHYLLDNGIFKEDYHILMSLLANTDDMNLISKIYPMIGFEIDDIVNFQKRIKDEHKGINYLLQNVSPDDQKNEWFLDELDRHKDNIKSFENIIKYLALKRSGQLKQKEQ